MLVFSYGGSLIFSDGGVNANVKKFIEFLGERRALVVVGGGRVAREYQEAARSLGVDGKDDLDSIAISVTRVNASMLQKMASPSRVSPVIPAENVAMKKEAGLYDLVFMGGTVPGQTTDMVALKACAALGEDFLYNLTKVDGVFEEDPSENPDAALIEETSCSELERLWGVEKHEPGLNYPIEPLALSFARDNGIGMAVLNGNDIENLKSLLSGGEWRGTRIRPD